MSSTPGPGLLALLLVAGLPLASPAQPGRPALHKVLAGWIKAYEKNALDLRGLASARGKAHPIYGKGWLARAGRMDMTHRFGLRTLLDHVASDNGGIDAVLETLRLAAMGLLDGSASFHRPHFIVRRLANVALSRCTATGSMFFLMQTATGDFSKWSRRPTDPKGLRAAAILALGSMGKPVVRPTLQKLLQATEPLVRLAAVEALQEMQHPRTLGPLSDAMATEADPIVAQALVHAVAAIVAGHGAEISVGQLRSSLVAAIGLIGRTDWRVDLAIVEFLGRVRNVMAIPALIGILQRSAAAATTDREFSRRLRTAARETLVSLTGAIIPADQPAKWREFWEREKDRFVIAPRKRVDSTHTVTGFFGIPVRGSNVVFVIDTSGSMQAGFFPAGEYEPTAEDDGLTRLRIAKRQLLTAARGLPGDAKFNLIWFSSDVSRWRRELVRATKKSVATLAARLQRIPAVGGTNMFGALKTALEIKTLVYGSRYGGPVDEVFLLSDGEPTVGLTEPETILQVIRETNRYSSVRINTLYMGGGGDSEFMKSLAEQNGGRYVRL